MLRELRSDPLVRMLGDTTVVLVLLTLTYYLLPFRFDRNEPSNLGRLILSLALLGVVAFMLLVTMRRSSKRQTARYRRIQWLLSALYGLVLTFALVYAAIAYYHPDQFVGLETRTDALYFSVTIVSTVGFGDIHAEGTSARLLVTAHMLFNLIYLGTALRVLTQATPSQPTGEE
jgi:voltage-gated potassium channel